MPATKKLASPSTVGIHARNQNVGTIMEGPDFNMYEVAVRVNGSHYWRRMDDGTEKVKEAKPKKQKIQKPKKLSRGMTLAAVYDVKTKKAYQYPVYTHLVSEVTQPFYILSPVAYKNMTGEDVSNLATLPENKNVCVTNFASYMMEDY